MTCGLAVKRPHDYEAYVLSDADSRDGVEIKRSRQLSTIHPQCSPFRPQLGTLASSLMQSMAISPAAAATTTTTSSGDQLPQAQNSLDRGASKSFGDHISQRCQLSSEQLESYLKAEVQYLRRRKLIPRHRNGSAIGSDAETLSDGGRLDAYRSAAKSPSSCHSGSGSDSEGDMSVPVETEKKKRGNMGLLADRSVGCSKDSTHSASLYDRPQFSLRQVKLICERLLNQQALQLRYEYETALNKKLEEQHDSYVQFSKEMLNEQTGARSQAECCSYLS